MKEQSKDKHADKLKVVVPVLEPMTAHEIAAILAGHYPQAGGKVEKLSDGGRPYSATSVLQTEAGEFFLKKRGTGWRTAEDILWRHRVIHHLRDKDFPTPAVYTNREGSTLTEVDGFFYELYERAPGRDIYREYHSWMPFDSQKHAFEAGLMLGRFHESLQEFDPGRREPPGTVSMQPMSARFDLALQTDLQQALRQRIEQSPVLQTFFSNRDWGAQVLPLYEDFRSQILAHRELIRPWVSHGDWHANNLFFENGRIVSVIDFHLTDISFRLYDLAVALDRNAIQWLDILDGEPDAVRYDVLKSIIKGYHSVLPLNNDELRLLAALLPIHQLDLAVTNIEYYLGIENSRERAEWVYNVYLLEHARHYQSAAGRRILDFVNNGGT